MYVGLGHIVYWPIEVVYLSLVGCLSDIKFLLQIQLSAKYTNKTVTYLAVTSGLLSLLCKVSNKTVLQNYIITQIICLHQRRSKWLNICNLSATAYWIKKGKGKFLYSAVSTSTSLGSIQLCSNELNNNKAQIAHKSLNHWNYLNFFGEKKPSSDQPWVVTIKNELIQTHEETVIL